MNSGLCSEKAFSIFGCGYTVLVTLCFEFFRGELHGK